MRIRHTRAPIDNDVSTFLNWLDRHCMETVMWGRGFWLHQGFCCVHENRLTRWCCARTLHARLRGRDDGDGAFLLNTKSETELP